MAFDSCKTSPSIFGSSSLLSSSSLSFCWLLVGPPSFSDGVLGVEKKPENGLGWFSVSGGGTIKSSTDDCFSLVNCCRRFLLLE